MLSILYHHVLSDPIYSYDNKILRIKGTGILSKEEVKKAAPDLDYQQIIIEEGIDNIGKELFGFSMDLQSVDIQHIKIIEEKSFTSCTRLQTIKFGEGLKEIHNNAFERCTSLESIIFPSTLTLIGNKAFAGVSKITEVTIPLATWNIGSGAFANCNSLKKKGIPTNFSMFVTQAIDVFDRQFLHMQSSLDHAM